MLNVVFASSNEYSPFLSISLVSLLENNVDDFDCINVFILDNGINEDNKNRILSLSEKYPCKITFIENNIFDSLEVDLPPIEYKSNFSLSYYTRLFIVTLLPNDIDKVLYLDCDGITVGSYKELWDMDLRDFYCAGVLDPNVNDALKNVCWYFDVENYFNSGCLLINLEKWRETNIEDEFIKFIANNQGKYFLADQGVLNFVLEDKIKIIEPKYNLLFYFQFLDYELAKRFSGIETDYYTKEIVDECRENPIFLHFAGGGYKVPWINKDHRYSLLFKKYVKLANCCEVIHYEKAPTFLMNLLYKNNKLLIFILKLIPAKIITNYKINEIIKYFKEEELKIDDFFNK